MKIVSRNSAQTRKIATRIAKEILKSGLHQKHARIAALVGELGAGKTTFAQGFAKALGIKRRMVSPTFLIFREYPLKNKNFRFFYHADVYRIRNPRELEPLHFKKILAEPRNVVLIEWADKIKKMLPKDVFWVEFRHGRKETERLVAYRR